MNVSGESRTSSASSKLEAYEASYQDNKPLQKGGPFGAMEFSNPNSIFPTPCDNVYQGAINKAGPCGSGFSSWGGLEKLRVTRR